MTLSQEIVNRQDDLAVSQIVSCQIGRRDVHISMPTVPNIRNGDEIVVAGWTAQGTLHARAYRNLDTGSYGRWKYAAWTLFVADPLVICVFAMLPMFLPLVLLWVVWDWWMAIRTYRASNAVLAEPAKREEAAGRFLENRSDLAPPALPIEPPRLAAPVSVSFEPPKQAPPASVPYEALRQAPPAINATEPPRQPHPATVTIPCPHCGKRMKMSPEVVGKKVRCPSRNCGAVVNTGRLAN